MSAGSRRPPRVLAALVDLFAAPHEADGILGDLAEGFSADAADKGDLETRRAYRRHASRAILDLMIADWRAQRWSIAILATLALTLWMPVGRATTSLATLVVTSYPVYYHVSARLFWNAVDLTTPLVIGAVVAIVAHAMRVRPMSAAFAAAGVLTAWIAVDTPILMWLYGAPYPAHITFAYWLLRLVRGVLKFVVVLCIGSAFGRFALGRLLSSRGLIRT